MRKYWVLDRQSPRLTHSIRRSRPQGQGAAVTTRRPSDMFCSPTRLSVLAYNLGFHKPRDQRWWKCQPGPHSRLHEVGRCPGELSFASSSFLLHISRARLLHPSPLPTTWRRYQAGAPSPKVHDAHPHLFVQPVSGRTFSLVQKIDTDSLLCAHLCISWAMWV